VHVATAGAVWNALAYGFAGTRDHGGAITFDPRLPQSWAALTFRLTIHGTRLRVTLRSDRLDLAIELGSTLTVGVRGKEIIVTHASPVTRAT
jgi:alpha,alpha-trehalose phosphorylase